MNVGVNVCVCVCVCDIVCMWREREREREREQQHAPMRSVCDMLQAYSAPSVLVFSCSNTKHIKAVKYVRLS